MRIFAVLLDTPSIEAFDKLEARYEHDFHRHSPTVGFVHDEDGLTADIAETAGIKGAGRNAMGIVLGIRPFYAGFTKQELWKWLEECEKSAAAAPTRGARRRSATPTSHARPAIGKWASATR